MESDWVSQDCHAASMDALSATSLSVRESVPDTFPALSGYRFAAGQAGVCLERRDNIKWRRLFALLPGIRLRLSVENWIVSNSSRLQTSPTLLGRLAIAPTDQTAWESFVERYGPRIYAWCLDWKLQQADAEDLTQEVLVKLAGKLTSFTYNPSQSFRAWLKTITRHALSDYVTSRQHQERGSGDTRGSEILGNLEARDDLTARLEREFDNEVLDEAAARVRLMVGPEKWDVFRMLAIEALPGAEVARRTNMKLATTYVVRSKVQKLLAEEIKKLGGSLVTPLEDAQ